MKVLPGEQQAQEVMRYGAGSYFGELALLSDKPRQASVFAVSSSMFMFSFCLCVCSKEMECD